MGHKAALVNGPVDAQKPVRVMQHIHQDGFLHTR
jgi:hypothetical protein